MEEGKRFVIRKETNAPIIKNSRWLAIVFITSLLVAPSIATAGTTDCNNNGIDDATDIANGTSTDCNGDGLLDECESDVAFRPIRSTLSFGPQEYFGALTLDVDLDGDQDFATIRKTFGAGNDFLEIKRNFNGFGPSVWDSQIFPVTISASSWTTLVAGDLDGDADIDIVVSPDLNGGVAWLENEDGMGGVWAIHAIPNSVTGDLQIFLHDVDSDGDEDLILGSRSQNEIEILLNSDGLGSFNDSISVATGTFFVEMSLCDIDGDHDMDVVTVGDNLNHCGWYQYNHVSQNFSSLIPIPIPFSFPSRIDTGDIDGDGDQDLLIGRAYTFDHGWMRNTDGNGIFELGQDLLQFGTFINDLKLADIDGDSDLDVLIISPNTLQNLEWRVNQDGAGTFSAPYERQQVFPIAYTRMKLDDMDGDDQQDIILIPSSRFDPVVIAYATDKDCDDNGLADACELADGLLQDCNGNGLPDSCDAVIDDCNANDVPDSCEGDCDFNGLIDACDPQISFNYMIAGTNDGRFAGLDAGDIDGDGDIDAITTDRMLGSVQWYANNGSGVFGRSTLVADQLLEAFEVLLLDVDEDGALDAIIGTVDSGTLSWCRNIDGTGAFGHPQIIDDTFDQFTRVRGADLDGDGDEDLVVTAYDGAVLWYEHLDDKAGFDAGIIINDTIIEPFALDLGDIDGDGDMDILTAGYGDNNLVWFENLDGEASFGNARMIHDQQPNTFLVRLFDWEGDGDLDVFVDTQGVSPFPFIGFCYVMVNEDGGGGNWSRRFAPVSRNDLGSGSTIIDLDGDDLVDIIRTEGTHLTVGTRFGRAGSPWDLIQLDNLDLGFIDAVKPADLNGDGDIDLLITAPVEGVMYAALRINGDCNNDGIPDHCQTDSDNDGIINDCEPPLGDMNCDGFVNFSDIPSFAIALTDAMAYSVAHPGCEIEMADMSGDGIEDGRDIQGFISALLAP